MSQDPPASAEYSLERIADTLDALAENSSDIAEWLEALCGRLGALETELQKQRLDRPAEKR